MSVEYTETELSDLEALAEHRKKAKRAARSGHPGKAAEAKRLLIGIAAEVAKIHARAKARAGVGVQS